MALKRKIWAVKVQEKSRKILSVLFVIMLVAFLLRFEVIADALGSILGVDGEKVRSAAGRVYAIALGVILLYTASLLISVPFVGVAFALVGVSILAYQLISMYNSTKGFNEKGKITGTGPFSLPL